MAIYYRLFNAKIRMKANIIDSARNESTSFIDFYDSIPEYHEINHLSNQEFYRKLERLKEKQKEFNNYLKTQIKFDSKVCNHIYVRVQQLNQVNCRIASGLMTTNI